MMKYEDRIVVELSGRDSVVALIDFIDTANKEGKLYEFIFSVVYIPAEEDPDPSNNIFMLGDILKMHAERFGHKILDMIYTAETGTWFELTKHIYGHNVNIASPCIACHMYCHMCRADICMQFDATKVLTGERRNHSGKLKLNQTDVVLDYYKKHFEEDEVYFIQPLLDIEDNDIIAAKYAAFCEEYDLDVDYYKFAICNAKHEFPVEDVLEEEIKKYLEILDKSAENLLDKYRKLSELAKKYEDTVKQLSGEAE